MRQRGARAGRASKLALAASLLLASAQSLAAWSLVTVGVSHTMYVDKASAERFGERSQKVRARALVNRLSESEAPALLASPSGPSSEAAIDKPGAERSVSEHPLAVARPPASSIFEISFDCESDKYQLGQAMNFERPMGEGQGAPSSAKISGEWASYKEGGQLSAMARALCPSAPTEGP